MPARRSFVTQRQQSFASGKRTHASCSEPVAGGRRRRRQRRALICRGKVGALGQRCAAADKRSPIPAVSLCTGQPTLGAAGPTRRRRGRHRARGTQRTASPNRNSRVVSSRRAANSAGSASSAAATLSASCSGRLAPMMTLVTAGLCSTQAMAAWAATSPGATGRAQTGGTAGCGAAAQTLAARCATGPRVPAFGPAARPGSWTRPRSAPGPNARSRPAPPVIRPTACRGRRGEVGRDRQMTLATRLKIAPDRDQPTDGSGSSPIGCLSLRRTTGRSWPGPPLGPHPVSGRWPIGQVEGPVPQGLGRLHSISVNPNIRSGTDSEIA
jgi:hypothetical protein